MSIAERHPPQNEEAPLRTRSRAALVNIIEMGLIEVLKNPPLKGTIATEVRHLTGVITKRPVGGNFNNKHTVLSLDDQKKIAKKAIENFSDARIPDKAAVIAHVFALLDTDKEVVAPPPMRERPKEVPGMSAETLLTRTEITKLRVGSGYFGVFELLDENGKPVLSPQGKSIYFEFGRRKSTGVIAHRIDASGTIIGPDIYLDEFPEYARALGGTRFKELKGTHSTAFDFSRSASKR